MNGSQDPRDGIFPWSFEYITLERAQHWCEDDHDIESVRAKQSMTGGYNTSLYTGVIKSIALQYDHSIEPSFWDVPLWDVYVGSDRITPDAVGTARVSTTEQSITVPLGVATQIFSRVPIALPVHINLPGFAQAHADDKVIHIWAYDCTEPPHIAFALGDQGQFAIDPRDLKQGEIPVQSPFISDVPGSTAYEDARRNNVRVCLASVVGGSTDTTIFTLGIAF